MLLQESPEHWNVLSVPTILLFYSFYSVERAPRLPGAIESFCGLGESVLSVKPARISSMIGPDFPPSPKERAWLAICVGVLGSDHNNR